MNKEHLSLADLVRLLESRGMNRSLIQRYDAEDDFKAVLEKNEETKTYPGWTLSLWENIADMRLREPLIVRPKLAARYIEKFIPGAKSGQLVPIKSEPIKAENKSVTVRSEPTDLIVSPPEQQRLEQSVSLPQETLERLVQAVERHAKASDEILTLEEACDYLVTTPNRLCRFKEPYVKLGTERKHWRWRKSDLIG